MKIETIAILCVFLSVSLFAQKRQQVEGTYTFEVPSTMSFDEACQLSLIEAQHNAIENEFGTMVTQDNTVVITDNNGQANTELLSISKGQVKGVWIGDIDEPRYEKILLNGKLHVKVTVKGWIREITSAGIDFIAKTLKNQPELKYEDQTFKDGDDLFLYFKSPADGFLTVYLFDKTTMMVYCLLPYQNSGLGAFNVVHDEPYYLFSPQHAKNNYGTVDELVMTCSEGKTQEFNDLYVIFSPNSYGKANAHTGQRLSDGFIAPRSLTYKEFNNWLVKYRTKDETMQEKRISLKITK